MFKIIKKYMKIYKVLVKQEIKRLMEYKGDFLVGIVGFLLTQAFNILFISIIFSRIPRLKGWDYNEIVFIYGFSLLPKGIDHLLTDNLWNFGHNIIRKGEFDKYITRPLNSLFYIISEKFQVDAFGELIVGVMLMAYSLGKLEYHFDLKKIIIIIIIIPFTALIYTAIKTITAALAFWVKRSGNIIYIFYMLNDFSKYPVSIYNVPIKFVLTYIVPFALTSYYPASYLLTGKGASNLGIVILVSIIFSVISVLVWNTGVSEYESVGS